MTFFQVLQSMTPSKARLLHAIFMIFLGMAAGIAAAPHTYAQAPKISIAGPPSPLAPVQENPSLPRVLLLGDSISIGYTLPLRAKLAGVANVVRPATNCGPSRSALSHLDEWLGDRPWDVIHFNFGLHDMKHVLPGSERMVAVGTTGSGPLEPPESYARNLRQIARRLQRTGARLIWCSTTPVPEGAFGRVAGEEQNYNAIANRVMREAGIEVQDLHKRLLAEPQRLQRPGDVHFTAAGSTRIAELLAPRIVQAITDKQIR